MNFLYLWILWVVLLGTMTEASAVCKTLSETVDLGQFPSLNFSETGLNDIQAKSGLHCESLAIGVDATSYLKYVVEKLPTTLVSSNNPADQINITLKDHKQNVLAEGSTQQFQESNFISLFHSASNDLYFFMGAVAGQNIAPGIYESSSPVIIRWYYAIPIASIGCETAGFDASAGFRLQGSLINCDIADWGEGVVSAMKYTIIILPDCRIATSNIDFGQAPFPSAFKPIQTSMGVRCSVKTPYSVSLNDGQNNQNGQRRMKDASGKYYLAYEIYKGSTQQRWGSSGEQLWSSNTASMNADIYDGKTQQSYYFSAEIKNNDAIPIATGTYTDNITVEVDF